MNTPSEAQQRSAAATGRLIAARELSSRAVVAACLERIAETGPSLNAVVALRAEAALAEAEEADRTADVAAERGDVLGPLHGVPFTVKDWIDVAGLPCAGGNARQRNRMPARDATVVARIRAAGGIVLGKTSAGADTEAYGRTNNPYDPRFSPAGSSSGEAAVIGAGGSPLGLGSDSGGSIRQPAHCCGVAGLKPTTGRVPLTGHFPFICAMTDPRTVIGPLARHVEDLALALRLIAGPDGADPSAVPVPSQEPDCLGGMKVAVYVDHPDTSPDPAVVAATWAAARALEAAGLAVEPATPPGLAEVYLLTHAYWRRPESDSADEWVADRAFDPASMTTLDVQRSLFEWDRFRRRMLPFLAEYPLVVSPAAEKPAVQHGEDTGRIPYTLTWSLLGNPAVVVRAGTTEDGLPVGVQIAAPPWREDLALAAASIVESQLGGWRPPNI
jgi:amidase